MDEQFLTAVETALDSAGVLRCGATLLVALSGGPDSVALLYAVCALRQARGFRVRAAHVEHGLRGDASLEDAHFCERLCAQLSVPFTCDHAVLEGDMDSPGAEARAREARYALLTRRARECRADALLLAHHQDDQAETVLSHLVRGSGAQGLAGMRAVTRREGVTLVRPLLTIPKQALTAALDGRPFCDDGSNSQPCCQRNRLRKDLLPLLEKENPRAVMHIAQSAALLAMDEDCLAAQAKALLSEALIDRPPFFCLRKEALLEAPPAVTVRALRLFTRRGSRYLTAEKRDWSPDARPCNASAFRETEPHEPPCGEGEGEQSLSAGDSLALFALLSAQNGQAYNLPHDMVATVSARYVHLLHMKDGRPVCPTPFPKVVPLHSGLRDAGNNGTVLRLSPYDPRGEAQPDGLLSIAVPKALIAGLTFRTPQTGDWFQPFGTEGGKPLRRYLMDRKIDPPFRPFLPIICRGHDVLWIIGVRASEKTRLTDEPSVLLSAQGDFPWMLDFPRDGTRCANNLNAKE